MGIYIGIVHHIIPAIMIRILSFIVTEECMLELFVNFHQLFHFFQEHANEIDFDYMEYARQRLQQYWLRKPELLGSFTDAVANGNSTSFIELHFLS